MLQIEEYIFGRILTKSDFYNLSGWNIPNFHSHWWAKWLRMRFCLVTVLDPYHFKWKTEETNSAWCCQDFPNHSHDRRPISSIAQHLVGSGHRLQDLSSNNFRILFRNCKRKMLHFIEPLAIRTMNPTLCVQKQSILAFQLPWSGVNLDLTCHDFHFYLALSEWLILIVIHFDFLVCMWSDSSKCMSWLHHAIFVFSVFYFVEYQVKMVVFQTSSFLIICSIECQRITPIAALHSLKIINIKVCIDFVVCHIIL